MILTAYPKTPIPFNIGQRIAANRLARKIGDVIEATWGRAVSRSMNATMCLPIVTRGPWKARCTSRSTPFRFGQWCT
jgi:hypothetical protein